MVDQLRALAPAVDRLSGPTRYGTARAVALDTAAVLAAGRGASSAPAGPRVVLASGESFADALSGGASAAAGGAVLLLTARDALPSDTQDALAALHPSAITVVGGPSAISDAVVRAASAATAGTTLRLYGADRFETAVAVQEHAGPAAVPGILLANGLDFPDALAGAALGLPLLLSRPDCLPATTAAAFTALGTTYVTGLGGTAALSTSALNGTVCAGASASVVSPPLAPAPTAPAPAPTVPAPVAGPSAPVSPGDVKNCTDFATWRQAQNWYDTYVGTFGDVARLDGDDDGTACEGLPGAPR